MFKNRQKLNHKKRGVFVIGRVEVEYKRIRCEKLIRKKESKKTN